MRRQPRASRRQVLTAAGAALALPLGVSASTRADAAPSAGKPTKAQAPECLADLVASGEVTSADFMAR